jgi:uncharacterized protein
MTTRTRYGAAVLGLFVGAVSGCAHQESTQAAPAQATTGAPTAQAGPETPAHQAMQVDQQLAAAHQRLEAAYQASVQAEQQRVQAREQLTQADQRATQAQQQIAVEQANVQRLDQASRAAHARAANAAMESQAAASREVALRTVGGRIAQVSPSRVVLRAADGGLMTFGIDSQTRVVVGTEDRSVADLQQGAEARVAYDPRGAPTAFLIRVNPAHERPAPAPQAAPTQPPP